MPTATGTTYPGRVMSGHHMKLRTLVGTPMAAEAGCGLLSLDTFGFHVSRGAICPIRLGCGVITTDLAGVGRRAWAVIGGVAEAGRRMSEGPLSAMSHRIVHGVDR